MTRNLGHPPGCRLYDVWEHIRVEAGNLGQLVTEETASVLNGKMAAVNSPDVFAGTTHSVFRFREARSTLKGRVETIAEDVKFVNMCEKG
jgi:hypothetical protein